jgi:hypothetical protein
MILTLQFTLLKTKNIINNKNIFFDLTNIITNLKIHHLRNYSIEKTPEQTNNLILIYKSYYFLFLLDILLYFNHKHEYQNKIKIILNQKSLQTFQEKIESNFDRKKYFEDLFTRTKDTIIYESNPTQEKDIILKIKIDSNLLPLFILNEKINNFINNENNEINKKYTRLENIIIKYFLSENEIKSIEKNNEYKTEEISASTIDKNNFKIFLLFAIMSEIKLAFYNQRDNEGGEGSKWRTHSVKSIDLGRKETTFFR